MGRYTNRLMIALFFSLTCYGATEYWFMATHKDRTIDDSKPPIATLIEFENQVQRKPISRLIWESITLNELLYAGESVRTSSNSAAKIRFENTGTVIELEPDSLIVLEEAKGKVTLNFVKGNIFLNNEKGGTGKSDLTIKAGKSEIRATASTNLNLSEEKGKINLDVFKGEAKLTGKQGQELTVDKSKSGQLTESGALDIEKNKFQILSPQANDTAYVDPRNLKPLVFKWKKLPRGFNVFLYTGARRGKLRKVKTISAPGEKGQLNFQPKVGKFYWSLRAVPVDKAKRSIKSKVFPLTVIAKNPPTLIFPKNKQDIVLDSVNDQIKIKWANKSKLENLTLQVAKDPQLRDLVIKSQSLSAKKTSETIDIAQDGTYYWRIIGYMEIKGKMEAVSSRIHSFNLGFAQELVPPRPKSPTYDQNILYSKFLKQGTILTWSKLPGIQNYKVSLTKADDQGEEPQFFEVGDISLKLTDLPSGSYYWSVASMSKRGETSPYSKQMRFNLKDLPRIQWTDGSEDGFYYYLTAKPSIRLSWKIDNAKVVSYRVRYSRDKKGKTVNSKWKETTKPEYNSYLPQDGPYEFVVEGLSKDKKIIARSLPKNLILKLRDILPAPTFSRSVPLNIVSEKNGNFKLSWTKIKGAAKYSVLLKDENGKVVKEYKFQSTAAMLKSLKPGTYKVSVRSVDQFDRASKESKSRTVEVPNTSSISAPKLKGIKVK